MSSYPGLWPQLQELGFASVTERPLKILLRSLRASHRPGAIPGETDQLASGEIIFPRSVFWRFCFGMLPLPPQIEQEQSPASPAAAVKSNRTAGPRRVGGKKSVFDPTSSDSSSSSSSSSSDSDDEDGNAKNNKKKPAPAAAVPQKIQVDYSEQQIRDAVDAARKEYEVWRQHVLNNSNSPTSPPPAADSTSPASPATEQQKKSFFSSSKKKAKPESAGPRFGDDSSSSGSDDDDEDTTVVVTRIDAAAAAVERKKASSKMFGSDTDDDADDNGNNSSGHHHHHRRAVGGGIGDPLLHGDDPKWQKYFARKKEMELVDKDLNRLYFNDIEFFEDPATRKAVRRILEASLDNHVVPVYAQGMHEVAAIALYVCHIDAVKYGKKPDEKARPEDSDSDTDVHHSKKHMLTWHVFSTEHLEHDAYHLYKKICCDFELGKWYENLSPTNDACITRLIDEVHGPRLSRASLPLHDHLRKYDIPVVTYGLRWLRLLFAREFTTSQALKLWDVAFAEFLVERKPVYQGVVPELMLSMLLFIGRELVDGDDHTGTLRRLMRYPPVEDITMIYTNALARSYPATGSGSGAFVMRELLPKPKVAPAATAAATVPSPVSPTPAGATPTTTGGAAAARHQPQPAESNSGGLSSMFDTIANLVTGSSHSVAVVTGAKKQGPTPKFEQPPSATAASSATTTPSPTAAQSGGGGGRTAPLALQTLKNKQRRLGERLARVIDILNDKWFPTHVAAGKEGEETGSSSSSSSDEEEGKEPAAAAAAAATAAEKGKDKDKEEKEQRLEEQYKDKDKEEKEQRLEEQYILAIAEVKRIRDELLGEI